MKRLDVGVTGDTNDVPSTCFDNVKEGVASSVADADDVDSFPGFPEEASTLLFVGGATLGGLAELK